MKRRLSIIFICCMLVTTLLLAAGCQGLASQLPGNAAAEQQKNSPLELAVATVVGHTDGDTVTVRLSDDQEYKLRMIGVDTPETVHPARAVEHYGKEASEFTKKSLLGKTVYLEMDQSETDRYGRLLRYVWLEPPSEISASEIASKLFNAILVKEGYAQVSTYPPDVKYQEYFLDLQRTARQTGAGLWGYSGETELSQSPSAGSSRTDQFSDNEIPSAYIGNSSSMKFHKAGCTSVGQMAQSNKVPFDTREEALSEGFTPCKICNP